SRGGDFQRADHRRAGAAGAAWRALSAAERRTDAAAKPDDLRYRRLDCAVFVHLGGRQDSWLAASGVAVGVFRFLTAVALAKAVSRTRQALFGVSRTGEDNVEGTQGWLSDDGGPHGDHRLRLPGHHHRACSDSVS